MFEPRGKRDLKGRWDAAEIGISSELFAFGDSFFQERIITVVILHRWLVCVRDLDLPR